MGSVRRLQLRSMLIVTEIHAVHAPMEATSALIWRGLSKGIEKFCQIALPLLLVIGLVVLVRVLTLDNVAAKTLAQLDAAWHLPGAILTHLRTARHHLG